MPPVQLGAMASADAAREGGWAGSSTPPSAPGKRRAQQVLTVDYFRVGGAGAGFSLPRVQMRNRRAAGQPQVYWIFQRHLETILYHRTSDGGSTGAIWKLLNKSGCGDSALQVNSAAVAVGQVLQLLPKLRLRLDHVQLEDLARRT